MQEAGSPSTTERHPATPDPFTRARAEASSAELLHLSRNATERVPILDGVRASAAVLVFLGHSTILPNDSAADQFWGRLFTLNGLGAIVFFILSGFLVTEVLLKSDRQPRYFFCNFYARRALRLLPLYYLVVIYGFVIRPQLQHLGLAQPFTPTGSIWMYLLGLSNFVVANRAQWQFFMLDVTWSLSIEFQFYVVWPIIVYFLSRRSLLIVAIAMILFGFAYRLLAVYVWDMHPISVYVSTFSRIGAFGWGAMLTLALRDKELLLRLRPYATAAAITTLPLIWLVIGFEDATGRSYQSAYGIHGGPITFSALVFLVSIGVCCLIIRILAATNHGILYRIFCSWPLTHFAKYSYAFFLLHVPVLTAISGRLYGPPGGKRVPKFLWFEVYGTYIPAQILFYVLGFICTFILAFLAWHLYEKQWLKLSRFFPSRPPAAKPIPSEPLPRGG